jgi:F-type H+-transporting ATPase subunit b
VLKDLADVELEQRIVEILMERIQTMDEEERGKFRDSLAEGGTITVQSAFDIPAGERKKLDDVIRRYINGDIQVVFEKSDNVMTGYELKTDGHKIAWSIKDYLDSLEEKFYHALYEEAQEKR